MRNILVILFLYSFQCFSQNQQFEINVDSININIKGRMSSSLFYKNKYYCYFEADEMPYSSGTTKYFYIMSRNGNIEHSIDVPEDIGNLVHFFIEIRNDSIITQASEDHYSYYLDTTKFKWIKCKEIDGLVFQDKNYYVTIKDFGEWGSTIWFKDKKTNIEYEGASASPTINKIKNEYFITTWNAIFKIADPLKMKICEQEDRYENIEKNEKFDEGSTSWAGIDELYRDSSDLFSTKSYLVTSFVLKEKLFHLNVYEKTLYISSLDNGKLIPIKTIGKNIFPNGENMIDENKRALSFDTDIENLFGFIEIDENRINIHYFKNKYSSKLKYLGTNKADTNFAHLFDYIKTNFENLVISQIDSIEQKLESTDISPKHYVELGTDIYKNPENVKLETPRSYLRIEDSTFTNQIEYYYAKNNGSIKAILLEWQKTNNFPNSMSLFDTLSIEKLNGFLTKFFKIEDIVTSKIGKPKSRKIESKKKKDPIDDEIIWKTKNGLIVRLNMFVSKSQDYGVIRMTIY